MIPGIQPSRLRVIAWLLSLLKPYLRQAAVSIICGFAAAASSVGLLATAAYLISAASLHPSVAELQVAIVGVRFFGLSRGVFRYLERLSTHSVNFRLLTDLRVWLYDRLEPLAPAFLAHERTGSVLDRAIGGLNRLETFYVRAAAPPLVAVITVVVVSLWLVSIHPFLAVIWLAAAFLLGLGLPASLHLLSIKPSRCLVQTRVTLRAWLVDHLQGLPDLLAFNKAEKSLTQAGRLQADLDQAERRLSGLQGLESAFSTLIVNLAGFGFLAAAIPLVNQGRVDRLLLAVVVIGGMAAFESLLAMPSAGRILEESVEDAMRLQQLASLPPPICEPASPIHLPDLNPEGLSLQVSGLNFSYDPGSQPALDGLTLSLPAGRHAALLGASGAGKTTLLNLIMRFWDYSPGSITLGGIELNSLSSEQIRRVINCLPPKPYIFNASLRKNLLMASPSTGDDQMWRALEAASLTDFISNLPAGLDTQLGEGGARLSAGEKQRLALARFLIHDGSIWVLDEPTAHLDAGTAVIVRTRIFEAAGSRTVLWLTHDLAGLEHTDWIYILRAGRLAEEGTPADLESAGGIYTSLLALNNDLVEQLPEI